MSCSLASSVGGTVLLDRLAAGDIDWAALGANSAMVLVAAVAFGATIRFGSRHSLLVSILLFGVLWATLVQLPGVVGASCGEYIWGLPRLVSATPLNPDRETRMEFDSSPVSRCGQFGAWTRWRVATIEVLVSVFGPPPRAYRGPYPTFPKATFLLKYQGTAPSLTVDGGTIVVDGIGFPVRCDNSDEEEALVETMTERAGGMKDLPRGAVDELWCPLVRRGYIHRAVRLSENSILVETASEIQLRVWDDESAGRLWASWERDGM